MKIIEGRLFVSYETLTLVGVSEEAVKKGVYRNSSFWQSIKDPDDKRKTLISYDSMREEYKTLIKQKYGDPYTWLQLQSQFENNEEWQLKKEHLRKSIVINADYYAIFLKNMDVAQAMEHARAAAWLQI